MDTVKDKQKSTKSETTIKISGAEAIIHCLLAEGVDLLYGYPGGAIMPVYDELYKFQDKLTHILTRHEQGATHAAQGYARISGDVGVAMGAMGSDVAIETADIIIQNDQPSKVIMGIKISKATKAIIWQNIYLAFGVKILVLILGAMGMATMWQAVFADVGVALLAILNAVRLQRMSWE